MPGEEEGTLKADYGLVGLYIGISLGVLTACVCLLCVLYHILDSWLRTMHPRTQGGEYFERREEVDISWTQLSLEVPSYEEVMSRGRPAGQVTPPPSYEKFISVIPPPLPNRSVSMQFSVHI